MTAKFDSQETLGQQAYHRLREQILTGGLRPGDRLGMRSLARALKMSQAPVGEAIRELTRDGLLENEPGIGARVRRFDLDALRSQHILRTALECEAARHCARWASDEQLSELHELAEELDRRIDTRSDPASFHALDSRFHLRIAELSRVTSLVETLRANQLVRMLALGSVLSSGVSTPPLQHVQVVEALASRDPDAAERALREHCRRSLELQLTRMALGGPPPIDPRERNL
jgi:DNA-binding GntR family transcriptional regulator